LSSLALFAFSLAPGEIFAAGSNINIMSYCYCFGSSTCCNMNYVWGLIDLDASNRSNDRIINYVLLRMESGLMAWMMVRKWMVRGVLVRVVL